VARTFVATSFQYLSIDSTAVTAVPVSFSAWIYPASSHVGRIVGIGSTGNSYYFSLQTNGQWIVMQTRDVGGTSGALSNAQVTLNVWSHVAGVSAAVDSRFSWLNGVVGAENTNSHTPVALDRTRVAVYPPSNTQYFDGRIADVAIWSAALTADEIVALSKGVHPRRICPSALKGFYPIWGLHSPEVDLSGLGNDLALAGAPARADDPPVEPFSRRWWGTIPLIETAPPPSGQPTMRRWGGVPGMMLTGRVGW